METSTTDQRDGLRHRAIIDGALRPSEKRQTLDEVQTLFGVNDLALPVSTASNTQRISQLLLEAQPGSAMSEAVRLLSQEVVALRQELRQTRVQQQVQPRRLQVELALDGLTLHTPPIPQEDYLAVLLWLPGTGPMAACLERTSRLAEAWGGRFVTIDEQLAPRYRRFLLTGGAGS